MVVSVSRIPWLTSYPKNSRGNVEKHREMISRNQVTSGVLSLILDKLDDKRKASGEEGWPKKLMSGVIPGIRSG